MTPQRPEPVVYLRHLSFFDGVLVLWVLVSIASLLGVVHGVFLPALIADGLVVVALPAVSQVVLSLVFSVALSVASAAILADALLRRRLRVHARLRAGIALVVVLGGSLVVLQLGLKPAFETLYAENLDAYTEGRPGSRAPTPSPAPDAPPP